MSKDQSSRCGAARDKGGLCRSWPLNGSARCRRHQDQDAPAAEGASKTVQAKWSRPTFLEHQLSEIQGYIAEAVTGENYAAVAALTKQKREVRREIDQINDANNAAVIPATHEDHLIQMLVKVRRMCTQAETAGSWVAANSLSKREMDLATELAEHRAALQPEKPAQSAQELLEELESRISGLPPVVRSKLSLVQ